MGDHIERVFAAMFEIMERENTSAHDALDAKKIPRRSDAWGKLTLTQRIVLLSGDRLPDPPSGSGYPTGE